MIGLDGNINHIAEAEGTPKDPFDWGEKQSAPAPSSERMPDPQVTSCVLTGFQGMVFPRAEGGLVTVTYPIMFAPEG